MNHECTPWIILNTSGIIVHKEGLQEYQDVSGIGEQPLVYHNVRLNMNLSLDAIILFHIRSLLYNIVFVFLCMISGTCLKYCQILSWN